MNKITKIKKNINCTSCGNKLIYISTNKQCSFFNVISFGLFGKVFINKHYKCKKCGKSHYIN